MHKHDASLLAMTDFALTQIKIEKDEHDRELAYIKAQRKQQLHTDDSQMKFRNNAAFKIRKSNSEQMCLDLMTPNINEQRCDPLDTT